MKEMVGGCCVCSDDRGWAENPLVYCDGQGCTVAVHQACYGIVTVPTGNWYCRKCESQERTARVQRCELCPSKDGALKRTDTNGWAHVVCALYIPEVRFGNVTTMEPILLQQIPPERFNKVCYICEESGKGARSTIGACMQCNKSGCKQQFHVTCAQALGLLCEEAGNYLDNVKYCGYCQHHYSKLKKTGNVKTIPPYRPITAEASDSSSPEKEPGENWSKTTAKRKLSAAGKPTAPGSAGLKAPVNVSPGPSSMDAPASQGDDIAGVSSSGVGPGSVVQMKDAVPVLTQVNTGKSDSVGGKFTTSNFVEGVVTPSESVFGEVSKSSSKKRKKDDVVAAPVGADDSSKKFKSDNIPQQEGVQPTSVVVKLPVGGVNAAATGGNSPVSAAPLPSRIVSTSSLSSSTTSSIVVSVPLATVSALPATVAAPTITAAATSSATTQSLTAASVTTTVSLPTTVLTNSNTTEESPTKRGRSQSTEKTDKSGRNKKRGGGSVSTNVGSKRGGRSNQSTPPPPPPPAPLQPPAVVVTVSGSSVTTSVVTATTPAATTTVVTQPTASPASVVAHSSAVVKVESPPSSPDGTKRSNHRPRKHQNVKDEKDSKQDVKVFQNGINAPHMLGNQLNPASTMAQKMSDTLNQELEAHSIFTNEANLSSNNLVGPQLHSRVIASVRSSNASSTAATTSSGSNTVTTTTATSGVGWGGGQGTVPQTLDQLLERQWEQGSQFLMEQAQHFDIASLLSCLHQLRAENLRLEEHVNSLLQRRDHLLAVNARLAIPLTQGPVAVNNVHPAVAGVVPGVPQPTQVVQDGSRGSSQRVNNSYPTTHPLENGLPPSPPTTAYRASPAQPSPSTISRHHSPGNPTAYVSSTPGVVVPRGSVTSESHRSESRRSNSQPAGPPPPQSAPYPAMYQVPQQQQQMVMRREVVADLHNQIPPASKPS